MWWLGAVAATVVLVACSPAEGDVQMTSARVFAPVRIEVAADQTVRFFNDSAESHTVTLDENLLPEGAPYFASGNFSSEEEARDGLPRGLIKQGESFEITFAVPGEYAYFCIPHEDQGMVGVIVVEQG
jgi:plastocyanin